jgi:ATP-binding cassette subfamily B protein
LKQANSGSIFINSCDLNAINLKSYYKRIAYIDQSIYLINGSIRENITLGKLISDQELAEVVEKTQLSSFVGEDLSGLDRKLVSNGLAISGGEKQRIALARAIVKDVDFIIIDETTSQLDKENRLAIEETILGLQDIGVIYISHNTESKVLELFDEVLDSRCFK